MSGKRSAVTILALITALATSWTPASQTPNRPGIHYFVLDPATGHGFVAIAGTCAMPAAPARAQPTSCGGAGSPCNAVPVTPSARTCGSMAACGICFALGQLAMHTTAPSVVPDDGPLAGRIESDVRSVSTRYLRPPKPPPRVV